MEPSSTKQATLLVYEFKFNSYRGARIKEANILFEFHPAERQSGGPSVSQVRPRGVHKMEQTTQKEKSKLGIELSVIPQFPRGSAGLELANDESVEKVTNDYTVVTGDNPQSDDWGNFYQARFTFSENQSRKTGIPCELTACILLERDDDQDFGCRPYVEVKPDFATMIRSLFSTRAADDPILFSVEEAPFNELDGQVDIDINNLGAIDLDMLWDCTMYSNYSEAVKSSKPVKKPD